MRWFAVWVFVVALTGCGGVPGGQGRLQSSSTAPSAALPDRSQVPVPNNKLTPGAVIPGVDVAAICRPGYAHSVRNVSPREKSEVYAAYGITKHTPGQYEIDHLISLELGGSNDPKNLWPEPYNSAAGAHQKDGLENYMHRQVCSGKLALDKAQTQMATDWYGAWLQAGRPSAGGGDDVEDSNHQ
jgi:hypothetical protein